MSISLDQLRQRLLAAQTIARSSATTSRSPLRKGGGASAARARVSQAQRTRVLQQRADAKSRVKTMTNQINRELRG